jgi:hypothetical protein
MSQLYARVRVRLAPLTRALCVRVSVSVCVCVCNPHDQCLRREFTVIEFQLFRDVDLRSLLTVKTQDGDSLFEPIIAQYNMVRSLQRRRRH